MRDFRSLKVWEKSHVLTLEIYRVTSAFPPGEMYGLTAQLRRAAASVPANLAEGCGKNGDREFGRFVDISLGSASETEYHLLLAKDLGYLTDEAYGNLADRVTEVKRMLTGLARHSRASTPSGHTPRSDVPLIADG